MVNREPSHTGPSAGPAPLPAAPMNLELTIIDPLSDQGSLELDSVRLDDDIAAAIAETLAAAQPSTPHPTEDLVDSNLVDSSLVDSSLVDSTLVSATAVGSAGASGTAVTDLAISSVPSAKPVTGKETPESTAQPAAAEGLLALPRKAWRDRLLMRSVPSWLVSMILHVGMLMALAAIQIEPVRDALGVMITAVANDEGTALEESLELDGADIETPAAASMDQALAASASEFSAQEISLTDSASLSTPVAMSFSSNELGSLVENIVPSSALSASTARLSSSLSGRSSGSMKSEMLERYGGNAASEKSVALALDWLANHQDRSGGWTFGHSRVCRGECKDDGDIPQSINAATALALLPFLGAGQTHLQGKYKTTIQKGLNFLISRMKVTKGEIPHGSWHEDGGSMYSHGLASIVVCEAYAMTRDPGLIQPAQLAINYIVYAQDPRGGGWRYSPKQAGDTSVVGWQLMALKSGSMGNLTVPMDSFRLANSFLDEVSVNNGAYYGYDERTSKIEGRQSTTAVGLLCRMYLGWSKDKPGMQDGVKFLAKRGPSVDDLYYSYYATQVLRQYGGEEWNKWNKAMRDGLIKAQVTEGHAAGSWYSAKGHNTKGGRLYCTAMSTMILEVYYRHLPLYSDKSSDEEFEF